MYTYNWVTLPYTWKQQDIVNQKLYFNKKKIKKKKLLLLTEHGEGTHSGEKNVS